MSITGFNILRDDKITEFDVEVEPDNSLTFFLEKYISYRESDSVSMTLSTEESKALYNFLKERFE